LSEFVTLKDRKSVKRNTINLSELNDHNNPDSRDEYRNFVSENYYISRRIKDNLHRIITDINEWKHNQVYLMESQYGSGKSHFVAFLQLLMENHKSAWEMAKKQNFEKEMDKKLLVVPISLGFQKRKDPIENIIKKEVQALLKKPIIPTDEIKNLMDNYPNGTLSSSIKDFIDKYYSKDKTRIESLLIKNDIGGLEQGDLKYLLAFTRRFYEKSNMYSKSQLELQDLFNTIWEDYARPEGFEGVVYILDEFFEYTTSWDPESGRYMEDNKKDMEHKHRSMFRTLTDEKNKFGRTHIMIVSQDNPEIEKLSTMADTGGRAQEMVLEQEDFKDIIMFRLFGAADENRIKNKIQGWWSTNSQVLEKFSDYSKVMDYFPFIASFNPFKNVMANMATTRIGMPIAYNTVERLLDIDGAVVTFDELLLTMVNERTIKGANVEIIKNCIEEIELMKARFDDKNTIRNLRKVFLTLVGFHLLGRTATPESVARVMVTTNYPVGGLNPWEDYVGLIKGFLENLTHLQQITSSDEHKDGTVIYSYQESGGVIGAEEKAYRKKKRLIQDNFADNLLKHHFSIEERSSSVAREFKRDHTVYVQNLPFKGKVEVKTSKGRFEGAVPEDQDFVLVIVPFPNLMEGKPPSKRTLFWNLREIKGVDKETLIEEMVYREMIDTNQHANWALKRLDGIKSDAKDVFKRCFIDGRIENEDGEVKRNPSTTEIQNHLSAALNTLFLKPPTGLYCWHDKDKLGKSHYPQLKKKFLPKIREEIIDGFVKLGDNRTLVENGTAAQKKAFGNFARDLEIVDETDPLNVILDVKNPICTKLNERLESELAGTGTTVDLTAIVKEFTSQPLGLRKELFDIYLYALIARKNYELKTKTGDEISAVNMKKKELTDKIYFEYGTISKTKVDIGKNKELIKVFFSDEDMEPEDFSLLLTKVPKKFKNIRDRIGNVRRMLDEESFKLVFGSLPSAQSKYLDSLEKVVEPGLDEDNIIRSAYDRMDREKLSSLELFDSIETFKNREWALLKQLLMDFGNIKQKDIMKKLDDFKKGLKLDSLITVPMPEENQLKNEIEDIYDLYVEKYIEAHNSFAGELRDLHSDVERINQIIKQLNRISILKDMELLLCSPPCEKTSTEIKPMAERGRACDCGYSFDAELPSIDINNILEDIKTELQILTELPELKSDRYVKNITSTQPTIENLELLDDDLVQKISGVVSSIKTLNIEDFISQNAIVNDPHKLIEEFRKYLKKQLGVDDLDEYKDKSIRIM